ncbi:hypothetical protein [Arthrobacter castelli]|uniref:hypothetical protein n=1 Tax=Arthrobacter castelli TaxID=271431 RepID=UPI0012DF7A39|nr:hypothetical protein [Arthrobacter castelli]
MSTDALVLIPERCLLLTFIDPATGIGAKPPFNYRHDALNTYLGSSLETLDAFQPDVASDIFMNVRAALVDSRKYLR